MEKKKKIMPAVYLQSADALIPHCLHPSVAAYLRARVQMRTNSPSHQVLVSIARFTLVVQVRRRPKESRGLRQATRERCHRKAPPRGRDTQLDKHRKLPAEKFTPFWGCLSPPSRRHSGRGSDIPRCAKEEVIHS